MPMPSEETLPVDLFICHSGVDKPWAKKLGERVEAESWEGRPLRVFLDEWDIEPGDNILLKLDDALATCRFLAVVMSPEMLTSEWCKAEYVSILTQDPTNRRGRLVPLRRRDTHATTKERLRVPPILGSLNHLDFRSDKDFESEFRRLLAKLRGEPPPRGRSVRGHRPSPSPDRILPALPERPDEPDQVGEVLLSNLLPVVGLPKTIWSAVTSLRAKADIPRGTHLPPFVLRENRAYTFLDLSKRDGAFSQFVDRASARPDTVVAWQSDEARWRWYIELLNLFLRGHLRPEAHFDPEHRRFWFVPRSDTVESVRVQWGAGTKRTVVRAPDPGSQQNWVHHAARLQFETIGQSVYLGVSPTYVFTVDGWNPVPRDAAGPLVTRWAGRERNKTILGHVLLWADFVTRGRKVCEIRAGDQSIRISRLPATVEAPVGLTSDRVQMRALLSFSDADEQAEVGTFSVLPESDPDPAEEDGDA